MTPSSPNLPSQENREVSQKKKEIIFPSDGWLEVEQKVTKRIVTKVTKRLRKELDVK